MLARRPRRRSIVRGMKKLAVPLCGSRIAYASFAAFASPVCTAISARPGGSPVGTPPRRGTHMVRNRARRRHELDDLPQLSDPGRPGVELAECVLEHRPERKMLAVSGRHELPGMENQECLAHHRAACCPIPVGAPPQLAGAHDFQAVAHRHRRRLRSPRRPKMRRHSLPCSRSGAETPARLRTRNEAALTRSHPNTKTRRGAHTRLPQHTRARTRGPAGGGRTRPYREARLLGRRALRRDPRDS